MRGIVQIADDLASQDNRITHLPIFVVEQKRRICGVDLDFCEEHLWIDLDGDCRYADDDDRTLLETKEKNSEPIPKNWRKVGYLDVWEFVTACLTEQGCKDYIEANGHNLKEPRIYVHSGYRNKEWESVRKFVGRLNDGMRLTMGSDSDIIQQGKNIKLNTKDNPSSISDDFRDTLLKILRWADGDQGETSLAQSLYNIEQICREKLGLGPP